MTVEAGRPAAQVDQAVSTIARAARDVADTQGLGDLLRLLRRRHTRLRGGAALATAAALRPAWASSVSQGVAAKGSTTLGGEEIRLTVDKLAFPVEDSPRDDEPVTR